MKAKLIMKGAEQFLVKNSPHILAGIAVTGVATTAYFTGKASFKAARLLESERRNGVEYDLKDQVFLTWRLYIPSVLSGLVTTACVIGTNRLSANRAAVAAAAYSVSERAFREYKDKVINHIGEAKERSIRDEIAQDEVNRTPVRDVIITESGDVMVLEAYTGRYFKSDVETIKKAQNDLNYQIINDGYASLSDFYDKLDLPHTDNSDNLGWNHDTQFEIQFSTAMTDTQKPCLVITYQTHPILNFYRY